MKKLIQCAVASALLINVSTAFAVPDNLRIIGNLVEEPCTILPGDENILMEFFDTPEKTFTPMVKLRLKSLRLNWPTVTQR
ncbi:hypothetical protein AB6H32_05820 [Providencia hangzhouensis]